MQDLASGAATCDPSGRPYNLMLPALAMFRIFGLGETHHLLSGVGLGLLMLSSILLFSWHLRSELSLLQRSLFITLSLLSFPMQLALERGNTDLVVLSSLFLICISLTRYLNTDRVANLATQCLLGCFSVVFKLWAGPGLITSHLWCAWVMRRHRKSAPARSRPLLIAALVLLGTFLVSYASSEHVFRYTETWQGRLSFGIDATYYSPDIADPGLQLGLFRALKLLIVSASSYLCWIRIKRHSLTTNQHSNQTLEKLALTIGFSTYLSVYLLSVSWDYRLMSLILCLPHTLSSSHTTSAKPDGLHLCKKLALMLIIFITFEQYLPLAWMFGIFESTSDIVAQPMLIGLLLAMSLAPELESFKK